MQHHKTFVASVAAIIVTGVLLNLANKGTFGTTIKGFSNYVTGGYGAGPLA